MHESATGAGREYHRQGPGSGKFSLLGWGGGRASPYLIWVLRIHPSPFPVCFSGCVICTSLQKQNQGQPGLGGTLRLPVQASPFTDQENEVSTPTRVCNRGQNTRGLTYGLLAESVPRLTQLELLTLIQIPLFPPISCLRF